jgi:hypothetical protein
MNDTVPSEIIKNCYFGLSNHGVTALRKKVHMLSQEYVIREVSSCGHGERICYVELAAGGPHVHPLL